MSFQQFNGYGGQALRDQDKVVIYLSPKQPIPDMVPYELHEHVFPEEWHMRVTAIRDMAFHYYKPLFERIWFMVAFFTTIILPLALFRVIFNSMYQEGPHTSEHFFQARAVSMAVLIGTILFFWLPILIWKGIGKRQMRSMIDRWAQADRAAKGPNVFIPVWAVQTPSIFKSTTVLTITTPPNAHPSLFHPDAYLPPFINAPNNVGDAYFYPYAPGKVGIPRMSVVGNLPAYSAGPGDNKHFDDVKV